MPNRYILVAVLVALFGQVAFAQQQPANPAVITAVTADGVGYVTSSTDSNGVNGEIGRWDTPYTGGLDGPPMAGVEPNGQSLLYIDVDVNDGGLASFSYRLKTWDGGIWDWYDISMETPSATVNLVSHLGMPGNDYGTYFETPSVALKQSLNKYKNQHVRFVFSVQQDGYGDQTLGEVMGFGLRSCSVPPLTPISDPTAQRFENGDTVDTDDLQQNMQDALTCLEGAVEAANGTIAISSAYRPPAYQQHLREVWDRWHLLRDHREEECNDLRTTVQGEFQRHGLLDTQRPATAGGPHTQGAAIDMRSSLTLQQFLPLALQCNLIRPLPVTDPVHFVHQ